MFLTGAFTATFTCAPPPLGVLPPDALLGRRAELPPEPVVAGEALVDLFLDGGGGGGEQGCEKGERGRTGHPRGGSRGAPRPGQEKYPQIVMIRKKKTKAIPARMAVGRRYG